MVLKQSGELQAPTFTASMLESIDAWQNFHNTLTDHRQGAGITQTAVAQTLGITQPSVSAFESNNYDAKISTLISYAAALGLQIEFSVREANYPELPKA